MNENDMAVWSACDSLADMRQAMVRWLRGEVDQSPSYGGPPNDETAEIVDDLVALNEAGLLTTGSQPGSRKIRHADGEDYEQRAYLDAYADWATAIRVVAACERVEGLEVRTQLVSDMVEEFTEDEMYEVPRIAASRRLQDGWVKTSLPVETDAVDSDMHFRFVGDGAWQEAERTMVVIVVDMQWGRSRLLWDTLVNALSASSTPA